MTTDPRILVCATAVREAHERLKTTENYWHDLALAAVLKWLAQEPTKEMWLAAEQICPHADDTWRTMCDQAKREIGG